MPQNVPEILILLPSAPPRDSASRPTDPMRLKNDYYNNRPHGRSTEISGNEENHTASLN